jgi:selenocysteine lyase/cysteine desulfurase
MSSAAATALLDARKTFPALRDRTFLDAACVSLIAQPVHDAIRRFLDLCLLPEAGDASRHHIEMDEARPRTVAEAARLLNADPASVALVESTSHGLTIVANALPLRTGDRVLIADTEFLQVAIPWQVRAKTAGIEIVPVPTHDEGVVTPDDFASAMDARTKVVCVSSVQWNSGWRIDLAGLGELCRLRGIWLIVDAIQELGACPIDMRATPVDALVAGGHKWLNAPFGCGILYLGPRILQELEPAGYGYLAVTEPDGGWDEYFRTPSISPYSAFTFVRTAKRFEIGGTSNYPGAIGLGASLRQINEIGTGAIHAHIQRLTDRLHEELSRTGARVVSKREPASARSGITTFTYDDVAHNREVLRHLLSHRVQTSIRYTSGVGGIRVSTHFFNDEEDVEKLVHAVRTAQV